MKSDKYNIQTHYNYHSTKQRGEFKKTHPSHPESKAHHYTYKEEKERITFFSSRQNEKLK